MKTIMLMLLNQVMSYLCGRLWDIAQQWVTLYEDRALTGAEKRERVAAMVREEAASIGVDIANSLVYLAVEAAVQAVRARAK